MKRKNKIEQGITLSPVGMSKLLHRLDEKLDRVIGDKQPGDEPKPSELWRHDVILGINGRLTEIEQRLGSLDHIPYRVAKLSEHRVRIDSVLQEILSRLTTLERDAKPEPEPEPQPKTRAKWTKKNWELDPVTELPRKLEPEPKTEPKKNTKPRHYWTKGDWQDYFKHAPDEELELPQLQHKHAWVQRIADAERTIRRRARNPA